MFRIRMSRKNFYCLQQINHLEYKNKLIIKNRIEILMNIPKIVDFVQQIIRINLLKNVTNLGKEKKIINK